MLQEDLLALVRSRLDPFEVAEAERMAAESNAAFNRYLARTLLRNFETANDEIVVTQEGGPEDAWSRIVHRVRVEGDAVVVTCNVTLKADGPSFPIVGTLVP